MEECDFVVTMPTVNLNGRSGGVSLSNRAYGRLKAGDLVQMEVKSHFRAGTYEAMRVVVDRNTSLYVSFPSSWGFDPGELVTVRMIKVGINPNDSEDDADGNDDA